MSDIRILQAIGTRSGGGVKATDTTRKITLILSEATYDIMHRKARAETETGQLGPYIRDHLVAIAENDTLLRKRRRATRTQ